MARRDQPINAGVPTPGEARPTPGKPQPAPGKRQPTEGELRPGGRRGPAWRPVPGALKAIGALVLVAVVFIVAAIVGGGSGEDGGTIPGAAPSGGQSADEEAAPATGDVSDEAKSPEDLGYPGFATNNTTRVGGADPASNAAAAALAVYPSGEEGLGPAAVVLVSAGDWRGAIASAVLMAQPLQAPILIGETDGVPEPTADALEALDPPGTRLAGDLQAFAVGGVAVPDGLRTRRIGATGAAAAAAIVRLREHLFDPPPRRFVLAPESQPEFAMPAAAWAARSGDPVLFTAPSKLPEATRRVLEADRRTPVYVLGPSSAVSTDVVREVERIGNPVSRVSGEDPVANAIALARYADGDFGWDVNDPGHGFVVARSDSPLDAAAAAPLSASGTWGPLLLTDSADTLPAALRDYLLDVKPGYTTDPTRAFYNHVWLIGDAEAIGVEQQAEIDELAELARIGGEP